MWPRTEPTLGTSRLRPFAATPSSAFRRRSFSSRANTRIAAITPWPAISSFMLRSMRSRSTSAPPRRRRPSGSSTRCTIRCLCRRRSRWAFPFRWEIPSSRPRQAGGRALLTVIASVPGLGDFVDSKSFTVNALSDLTVTRVWQNEVSLLHQRAQVRAEISNLGFPVQGPIPVEFRYFSVDPRTGQPVGVPVHVSRLTILDGETFAQGEPGTVVDETFEAEILGIYYVVVVVD